MRSFDAPMKIKPPAVEIGPPPELFPPVFMPGGVPSVVPNGTCHAMSPVLTSIAVSLPHGGCQHGHPLIMALLLPPRPASRPYNRGDSAGAPGSVSCFWMERKLPESVVLMM